MLENNSIVYMIKAANMQRSRERGGLGSQYNMLKVYQRPKSIEGFQHNMLKVNQRPKTIESFEHNMLKVGPEAEIY